MVAVDFIVRAGLARGCVHGLCYGLQGRCAQQGSQQARFLRDSAACWSTLCLLPACIHVFSSLENWRERACPGFHLISSCDFSERACWALGLRQCCMQPVPDNTVNREPGQLTCPSFLTSFGGMCDQDVKSPGSSDTVQFIPLGIQGWLLRRRVLI